MEQASSGDHMGEGHGPMHDPEETRFTSDALDLDAALWVRGVDYLSGWREATDAARSLADALETAGVTAADIQLRADTGPDGSGIVSLKCSPEVARTVARLVG
ncbi:MULTISPECIES: hypothetical protein [Streptomyces]|uniref:hypothetical protein n=1 Tax=Streptomyces TaxID=1883 RepID=UPI0022490F02|nr:hypothetical protein [Streptomyces sp. JHD 1]MCX2969184.1 hypothetical protein [Streptomyces sp. JHD 1]